MKAKEIRTADKTSLTDKIRELRKELVKINAQIAIGSSVKNPGQVRELKKTIARIITIQDERKRKARLVKKPEVVQKG